MPGSRMLFSGERELSMSLDGGLASIHVGQREGPVMPYLAAVRDRKAATVNVQQL
jgi:hypothetical protein